MLMSCVLSLLISATFSNLDLVAVSDLQGRKKEGRERGGGKEGKEEGLYPGHMMLQHNVSQRVSSPGMVG